MRDGGDPARAARTRRAATAQPSSPPSAPSSGQCSETLNVAVRPMSSNTCGSEVVPMTRSFRPSGGWRFSRMSSACQHDVAEPRADGDVVQEPLDVVQHDERQRAICTRPRTPSPDAWHLPISDMPTIVSALTSFDERELRCRWRASPRARSSPPRRRPRAGTSTSGSWSRPEPAPRAPCTCDAASRASRPGEMTPFRRQRSNVSVLAPNAGCTSPSARSKSVASTFDVVLVDLHGARFWKSTCRANAKDTADLTKTLDLGAARSFWSAARAPASVDVVPEKLVLAHLAAVNLEDLVPPRLVGEADLDVHLQAPGAQDRLVQHVLPVCHADEQDVVERVDAVDLGEELVHDGVVDAGARR